MLQMLQAGITVFLRSLEVIYGYFQQLVPLHVQQVIHLLAAGVIPAGLPDEFRLFIFNICGVQARKDNARPFNAPDHGNQPGHRFTVHVQHQPFSGTRRHIGAVFGNEQHPVRHGGKGPAQSVILAPAGRRKADAPVFKFFKEGEKRRVQFSLSIEQRSIHIGRNKFDGVHNVA